MKGNDSPGIFRCPIDRDMKLPKEGAGHPHGAFQGQQFKPVHNVLHWRMQITPFSRWERELPKLVADPRYQAVPTLRERRDIFEDFCRNAAEEHKRGKPDKGRAAREAFQGLIKQAENAEGGVTGPSPDDMETGRSFAGGLLSTKWHSV